MEKYIRDQCLSLAPCFFQIASFSFTASSSQSAKHFDKTWLWEMIETMLSVTDCLLVLPLGPANTLWMRLTRECVWRQLLMVLFVAGMFMVLHKWNKKGLVFAKCTSATTERIWWFFWLSRLGEKLLIQGFPNMNTASLVLHSYPPERAKSWKHAL